MNKALSRKLLTNAHDCMLSATEYARSKNSKDWKYAILNLASGIELVLKARLALEHWALLFDDIDSASEGKLKSGNFTSVNIKTSVSRLENISKVHLPKFLKKHFDDLRKIRNKIIHYNFEIHEFLLKCNIGDESFTYDLCNTLSKFKEFVSARMDSLRPQLEVSKKPQTWYFLECPYCLQDATVLVETKAKCLFCGHEAFLKDIAELISINGRIEACPSCETESVILHRSENDKEYWECIICGFFKGAPQTWVNSDGKQLPHLRD
jgi:Zn ribbon nucleic-acid-binding protein